MTRDSAPALPKSCIQIPVVTELGGVSMVERERLKPRVSECVCVKRGDTVREKDH